MRAVKGLALFVALLLSISLSACAPSTEKTEAEMDEFVQSYLEALKKGLHIQWTIACLLPI